MNYRKISALLILFVAANTFGWSPVTGAQLATEQSVSVAFDAQQQTPSAPGIPSDDGGDAWVFSRSSKGTKTAVPTAIAPTRTVTVTATPRATATPAKEDAAPVSSPTAINLNKYYVPQVRNPAEELRPLRLQIPSLGVDTGVELVGKDTSGRMDVPTNVDRVAWYTPGTRPGEVGNAVLAGHLDRIGGAPAVFWDLAKLKAGARIIVDMSDGERLVYEMRAGESYDYRNAPLNSIFGFDIRSDLNLITCRGSWDRGEQTYTQRYVVYSTLVERMPVGNQ